MIKNCITGYKHNPVNDFLINEIDKAQKNHDTESVVSLVNLYLDNMGHRLAYEEWHGMPITHNCHPVSTFIGFMKFYNNLNISGQDQSKLLEKFELIKSIFIQVNFLSDEEAEKLFY